MMIQSKKELYSYLLVNIKKRNKNIQKDEAENTYIQQDKKRKNQNKSHTNKATQNVWNFNILTLFPLDLSSVSCDGAAVLPAGESVTDVGD